MLVKIICGTYGHRPNPSEARVIRKDNQSPPFELNDEEAGRIISLGIAQSCNTNEILRENKKGFPHMTEAEIMSLDFHEMRKLAKEYGLDTKGTKEDLIYRFRQAFLEEDTLSDEETVEEDAEMPPELEAKEPE